MLTRLKVSGFKTLVDMDVRFGPFTCIAGPNGVGKSNLFDAIRFLSALADRPLVEAALSVRDEGGRTADLRSIFHRAGDDYDREMTFEAEMIVPAKGRDDLGQEADASITFLRYKLVLGHRVGTPGALELVEETLAPIKLGDASKHLLFRHKARDWRGKVVTGRRSGGPFISTSDNDGDNRRCIKLHQDGGGGGRPLSRAARDLPRTVLSAANAAESPTALMARREMQSWRLLQLEPSALREPDSFTSPTTMGSDGAHLAATLYHLAHTPIPGPNAGIADPQALYARVANRLAELIADVRAISVDRDERRELLTVNVLDQHGTTHAARALSDGTLRFLALAVVEAHPGMSGVLCLEEPENGIHPARIPAMLSLLQSIASDPESPFEPDEPLRQVIVNTHSPAVVRQVPDDCLLVAESRELVRNGVRSQRAAFSALQKTWRIDKDQTTLVTSIGRLLSYLNPVEASPAQDEEAQRKPAQSRRRRRVIDREDVSPYLPWTNHAE